MKWRKVKQARSYSNVSKKCNLCLWEKYFLICKSEISTLNNRNELTSSCKHCRKFLLNTTIISIQTQLAYRHVPRRMQCLTFSIYFIILIIFGSKHETPKCQLNAFEQKIQLRKSAYFSSSSFFEHSNS